MWFSNRRAKYRRHHRGAGLFRPFEMPPEEERESATATSPDSPASPVPKTPPPPLALPPTTIPQTAPWLGMPRAPIFQVRPQKIVSDNDKDCYLFVFNACIIGGSCSPEPHGRLGPARSAEDPDAAAATTTAQRGGGGRGRWGGELDI